MEYTLKRIDDDNIDILYKERQVAYAIFSYAINEWFIYVHIGIPINHFESILNKIREINR